MRTSARMCLAHACRQARSLAGTHGWPRWHRRFREARQSRARVRGARLDGGTGRDSPEGVKTRRARRLRIRIAARRSRGAEGPVGLDAGHGRPGAAEGRFGAKSPSMPRALRKRPMPLQRQSWRPFRANAWQPSLSYHRDPVRIGTRVGAAEARDDSDATQDKSSSCS